MACHNALAALLLFFGQQCSLVAASWEGLQVSPQDWPSLPGYGPQPNFPYMVDNQHNFFNASPDKGTQDGPVWQYSGSFDNFMKNLRAGHVIRGGYSSGVKPTENGTSSSSSGLLDHSAHSQRSDSPSYWLTKLGPLGTQPHAGSGYKFFRDVVNDYQADNSGKTDTTESINAAIQDGSRCGKDCGNTFTKGAIVYFPPGTYRICSPIIQLYYTQFIGDPNDPPIIKGCDTFKGIAMIDTDPYIPGTSGEQWYINQNQFFRHIRNFVFDMTDMPLATTDNGQIYVPTGIHWQAAQATTLQNLVFNMPNATDADTATHVGIFMENGSGGFVSDLVFIGGAIGWRAGSQQYTARNIKFYGCLTSVQMVWDWGFNWQGVEIHDGAIGFNISGRGGDKGQGTGSVSIIDCTITNVPTGILTNSLDVSPNIVLDNLRVEKVDNVVASTDKGTLLDVGTSPYQIHLWAAGQRYNGSEGSNQAAPAHAPPKGANLLVGDKLFVRSRPQYEDLDSSHFLVATNEGIVNDGSGDQAGAINAFLTKAASSGQVAYFPAGIYQVGTTVFVPTGSRIQGSSWSQIQGAGFYFANMHDPKVMVQVGNKGDVGNIEIVEMLFTVAGPTAGAVLMEWNVAAAHQGSAAMWDSHFRVGGATGTDLDVEHCPKPGFSEQCIAASMMLHVTQQASGYFENVWAWVADHDNDFNTVKLTDKTAGQIGVYGARGMLIESEGPSWFYGSGSEHSVLYNYQFYNAKNVYIGHLQTETPYFQPEPLAPAPFAQGKSFAGDPTFDDCTTATCKMSWGMRIIGSKNVTVHGAGLYSFFNDYERNCTDSHNCQERILEVQGSNDVAVFNLFTVGATDIALGANDTSLHRNETQSGYTTEVSIWLPANGQESPQIVYVGPEIWATPTHSSTIDPGNYTTSLEYGSPGTSTIGNGQVITTFIITTTIVTIDIPLLTIGGMPYYNLNVTSTATSGGFLAEPSVSIPPVGVPLPDGKGGTTTRNLTLPPWPKVSQGPADGPGWTMSDDPFDPFDVPPAPQGSGNTSPTHTSSKTFTFFTPFSTKISAARPTVTTIHLPPTPISPKTFTFPPATALTFATPRTTLTLDPHWHTTFTLGYTCPPSFVLTLLYPWEGFVSADCSIPTSWPWPLVPPPTPAPGHPGAPAPPGAPHYGHAQPTTMTFGGMGGVQPTYVTASGSGGGGDPTTVTLWGVDGGVIPTVVTLGGLEEEAQTTTVTFGGLDSGFVNSEVVTLSGLDGGSDPATVSVAGGGGGWWQTFTVTLGWEVGTPTAGPPIVGPAAGALPTMITLPAGYKPTTITLGDKTESGELQSAVITFQGISGAGFQPTTVTLEPGRGAHPTTISLPGDGKGDTTPTTITFPGGWDGWGKPEPTTTTSSTTPMPPLPFWKYWPDAELIFIRKDDPDPPEDNTDQTECFQVLFFKICIVVHIDLSGFRWRFPPGIYPPGPPPPGILKLPKIGNFKIEDDIELPPWPQITIGWDGTLSYPEEDSEKCEEQTARICSFMTSVTVHSGTTSRSTITGDCATITGCSATDREIGATATTIEPTSTATSTGTSTTSHSSSHSTTSSVSSTSSTSSTSSSSACQPTASGNMLNVCLNDAVVFPVNPENVGEIPDLLVNYTGKYETLEAVGLTGFYWVPALDVETYEKLRASPDVDGVDYYEQRNVNYGFPDFYDHDNDDRPAPPIVKAGNSSRLANKRSDRKLVTRDGEIGSVTSFWQTGVPSLPRREAMCSATSYTCTEYNGIIWYTYWWTHIGGWDYGNNQGWTVYVVGESGIWDNHVEFGSARLDHLRNGILYGNPPNSQDPNPLAAHGSGVIAFINGLNLGTCKNCRVVWTLEYNWANYPSNVPAGFQNLAELYMVLEDVERNNGALRRKAVVNCSWFITRENVSGAIIRAFRDILKRLDDAGVVVVFASGNDAKTHGKEIDQWPARLASSDSSVNPYGQLKNLIVVGASSENGTDTDWAQTSSYLTTFAPGQNVEVPYDPALLGGVADSYGLKNATSFAAPQVAGVIAYLRSLPGPFQRPLREPKNVKKMIKFLARRYNIWEQWGVLRDIPYQDKRPVLWNGNVQLWNYTTNQVVSFNCLKDFDTREVWDVYHACHGLDPDMKNMGSGESVGPCNPPEAGPSHQRKNKYRRLNGGGDNGDDDDLDADSCPLYTDPDDPLVPSAQSIAFSSASVAHPTCSAAGGCGGQICTGYYCTSNPTGTPPDHRDPKDPDNGQPVSSSTVTRSWSTAPSAPTELNSWSTDLYPTTESTTTTTPTTAAPSPTPTCDDKCKLDNGNACNCGPHGCDANSPSCCANAGCPDCFCSDTACDDNSPKCCLTNTCAWSWTGGGGGEFVRGGAGTGTSRQLRDRLAGLANASAATYSLWSRTNGSSGSWRLSGYGGQPKPATVCTQTPAWSAPAPAGGGDDNNTTQPETAGLQTWYANLAVFGDACDYLAGVADYGGLAAGAKVGALTCGRWATAACYRANHTDAHDCGEDKVAEELVCQW